jgi:hypothetical protein
LLARPGSQLTNEACVDNNGKNETREVVRLLPAQSAQERRAEHGHAPRPAGWNFAGKIVGLKYDS